MATSLPTPDESPTRLQRGLVRSTTGVVLLLALTALAAAAAVYLSVQSQGNADAARESLYDSLVAQARAERLGREIGSRKRALDAIASAAAIRPSDQLRDEAIVNLTRTDLVVADEWPLAATTIGAARLTFSPDLDRYATFTGSTARLFAAGSATPTTSVDAGETINRVLFPPDPDRIFLVVGQGTAVIWDLAAGAQVARISHPSEEFRASHVSLSPGGKTLTFASRGDHKVYIHDAATGALLHAHDTVPDPYATATCRGGAFVVSSGSDVFWFPRPDAAPERFPAGTAISVVDVSHDGTRIAFGGTGGDIGVIDTGDGSIARASGHSHYVDGVRLSPDGELLHSSSWSGVTRVWETRTATLALETNQATGSRFSADGSRLAFVSAGGSAGVWDVERSSVHSVISTRRVGLGRALKIDLSPGGDLVTATDTDDQGTSITALWDRHSGRRLSRSTNPPLSGVRFTADPGVALVSVAGLHLLPFRRDGERVVLGQPHTLDTPPGVYAAPQRVPGSRTRFSCIAWNDSTGFGVVVDTANPDTPATLVTGSPPEYKEGTFTVSPDLRFGAFSLWHNATTEVWDLATGSRIRQLAPLGGDAEFSADGRLLVGGTHAAYHIWKTGTWEQLATLPRQVANNVFANVGLSPDSRYAAITRTRTLTQLVDLEDFSVAATLQLQDPALTSDFVFSDDGETLLASQTNRLVLWDLPALRRNLADLGLPLAAVQATSPTPSSASPAAAAIAAAATGVALATLFGLAVLRYQRRLVRRLDTQYAEIQRTRDAFVQGEKMKALGTLSAGIAHDFRNLLSVIGLSNGLLKRAVAHDPDLAEETSAIGRAVAQGDKVVRSMLGFARTETPSAPGSTPTTDVADLVENLVAMLGQHFLAGIRLTLQLEPDLPAGSVPRPQLEQALLNLVVNAADAMEGHGTLTVTATALGPSGLPSNPVLAPNGAGRYIAVTVADTGPGIPSEVLPKVFDPFFTTKHQGATPGTGLGLSTVHTSCSRTGTGIHVETPPTGGTAVTLYIPS